MDHLRVTLKAGHFFAGLIYDEAEFCRNHGLLAPSCQRFTDNALAVPRPVVRGSIKEVDAAIQCSVNGAD